jgi:hypothetical protein
MILLLAPAEIFAKVQVGRNIQKLIQQGMM